MTVSTTVDERSGRPDDTQANKTQKTNEKETTMDRRNACDSEIPEWLQEFRENLVDDEIPVHGDSHASSSHEVSLEPIFKRREDLGKHSVYTHFPKDRSCEICQRTKITRAPCRRRNGGAVWPSNGSSRIRVKQKLHRKHREACKSSWSPTSIPKVIYTDNSFEFGKASEDLSWNHCTSTPHRSETNMGLLKEKCAE